MVPVNIRREGDHGELGNKVSSLFVDLPVAEATPCATTSLVSATTAKLKAGGQALAARRVDRVDRARATGAPLKLRALAVGETTVQRHDHQRTRLAASRVCVWRGDDRRRADRGQHAFGIAVVSYAGGMTFGLYADRGTVPDLDVIRDGIVTSLLELAALAHAPSAAR
jgi:diacylglycerol O-acyltransferase